MTQPKNSEQKVVAETAQIAEVAQSRPELRRLLRHLLRQKRQQLAADQKLILDEIIGKQLLAWCDEHQPVSLGVYWPIQSEPDLRPYYLQLQRAGVQLALPLVVAKDQPLSFLDWQEGDEMSVDTYGIAIPGHGRQVSQPAVLVIPCLGWNVSGYRLGYGGGFYDRTLVRQPRSTAIGIAYACTLADFAVEEHDIPMDFMISA